MGTYMDALTFFGGSDVISKTYPTNHPMRELLLHDKHKGSTTLESYDIIVRRGGNAGRKWLDIAKRELLKINNPSGKDVDAISSYNAILGEMRAYADLLRIKGWCVEAKGTGAKGPDFSITTQKGDKFVVEVFSYPPRPDNVILVDPPRTTFFDDVRGNKCSITSSVSVIDPFGFPNLSKIGDSTTANVISKICARKGSEYQFSDEETSILYLDLQSVPISWSMMEQLDPILKSNGTITAGSLWMAYYGRKGYPIFEEASRWNHRPPKCVIMGHDGHFYQSKGSKLSAVIVATGYNEHNANACRLGVIENAQRPLPDDIRCALTGSNLFDVRSRCLPRACLVQKLKEDRNKIYSAAVDVLGKGRANAHCALRV